MSLTEARERYPVVDLRNAKRSLATPVVPPPELLRVEKTETARPLERPPVAPAAKVRSTPIIQPQSISGRSLIAVIAIMSFLAALTLGIVVLVRTSANDWQSEVSRELTVQVRPLDARNIENDVGSAVALLRQVDGIKEVRAFTREESSRLLEPWLGSGAQLNDLPVPRLIVVTTAPGEAVNLEQLRVRLVDAVPSASIDDHRAFMERMRTMTRLAVLAGTAVLVLMLSATVLLVGFATRGAMASNRSIVEVLHFVGAKNSYVAGQFQRHFLRLGLKGAIAGGGAAMLVFLALRYGSLPLEADAGSEIAAMFGALALGPEGYGGMVGVVVLVSAVAAMTSRWTVHRTLKALD